MNGKISGRRFPDNLECPICLNTTDFVTSVYTFHVIETTIHERQLVSQKDIEVPSVHDALLAIRCVACQYIGPPELFGLVQLTVATVTDCRGRLARTLQSRYFSAISLLSCVSFNDQRDAQAAHDIRHLRSATSISKLPEYLTHEHPAVRRAAARHGEFLCEMFNPKIVVPKEAKLIDGCRNDDEQR